MSRRSPAPAPPRPRSPVLGFLARFVLVFAALECLIVFGLWRDSWFAPQAALNARLSALLCAPWIEGVQGVSSYLIAPTYAINIRPGCDAYQASAVLLAGIAAFPAPWTRKLWGALLGVLVLLVLNLVRLGAILWVGIHHRELFETMHLEVLPAVFLFVAVFLWLGWIAWVRPAPRPAAP